MWFSRRGWLKPAPLLLFTTLVSACGGAEPSPPPPSSGSQEQIQWEHVRTWSGRGSQFLDSFPSEGALRIEWDAKPEAGITTPVSLKIAVHSAISGRPLAPPVVDHAGEGKGVAYFSEEPRVFFLSVTADDMDWRISLSERVR